MLKHVGRLIQTKRRVILAFRTLPGDPTHCLVVTTENLESGDHDSLMTVVESNAGQNANEFAEVMSRSPLPDGSNMLAKFHQTGKLMKVSTEEVEMTPDLHTTIKLSTLNETIASQRGVTIADLAIKEPGTQTSTTSSPTPTEISSATTDVLSDEQLASNYRSQADQLFKEAKRLREQAESLVPTKRATKKSAKEEKVS